MKIKLLDKNCMLSKGYIDDAAWDLKSRETIKIYPGQTLVIGSGVCVEIPKGYVGDIRPRSSRSKSGLLIHYGTVDCGYTGEVKITVTNLNALPISVLQYERIAQLVTTKINEDNTLEIVDKLSSGARGEKGFGSTGK